MTPLHGPICAAFPLSYDAENRNAATAAVNLDVMALAQRFAMLMAEDNCAIGDGAISANEAKRPLRETLAIQQVRLKMKLNLKDEVSQGCAPDARSGARQPHVGLRLGLRAAPPSARRGAKLPPAGFEPAGLAGRAPGFGPVARCTGCEPGFWPPREAGR